MQHKRKDIIYTMNRTISSALAIIFLFGLGGCFKSAPIAYSSTDLHTNAFLDPTVSSVRGMSVGLIYSKFRYSRDSSKDGDRRKEELATIQRMRTVFTDAVTGAIRSEAPFNLVGKELQNMPELTPIRAGVQSRQKFLLVNFSPADMARAAEFIETNNIDAALTIDGSIEHTVLQKQRYMVLRIDWILIDRDGKELYNITTYNNAAIDDATLSDDTVKEIGVLAKQGSHDFAASIKAILRKD